MNKFFLEIISISLSAGWIVLIVLMLRLLLRKAPKWISVLLWGIVAVRLICPVNIESPVSLMPDNLGNGVLVSKWMDNYIEEVSIISEDSIYYDAAVTAGREPVSDGAGGYYVVTKYDQLGEPSTVENTIMPFLSVVWVIGLVLMFLYAIGSYLYLQYRVATAVRYRENIYQSENVTSPFVFGIIRPRIYLPFRLDEQNLKQVVAHEQAHIQRKDHWWKTIGFFLLTIHWFNPLIWLAYILLCRDIELACDEKVVQKLDNEQKANYMQALVDCSVNRRILAACPLAFGEVGVKERVKSVLNYKKPAFWIVVVAVVACIITAVCFLTNPVNKEQDLSFLYYKNAIPLVAEEEEVTAMYCPPMENKTEALIQIGVASGAELAEHLDKWEWRECNKPWNTLPSPGSVEFIVQEEYRIIVHERKSGLLFSYAVVKYEDEVHYYRIHKKDYEEAVALVHAPKEEPQAPSAGKTYIYEKEGIMGDFLITLYDDGSFSYYEGMASSYAGGGTWIQEGNKITLADNADMGYAFVNHFTLEGESLVFVEEGSTNFLYVKVKEGECFYNIDEKK